MYTDHFLNVLLALCSKNKAVAPTIMMLSRRTKPVMTGQRFLQLLGNLPPDGMPELCLNMMDACTGMVVETGVLAG